MWQLAASPRLHARLALRAPSFTSKKCLRTLFIVLGSSAKILTGTCAATRMPNAMSIIPQMAISSSTMLSTSPVMWRSAQMMTCTLALVKLESAVRSSAQPLSSRSMIPGILIVKTSIAKPQSTTSVAQRKASATHGSAPRTTFIEQVPPIFHAPTRLVPPLMIKHVAKLPLLVIHTLARERHSTDSNRRRSIVHRKAKRHCHALRLTRTHAALRTASAAPTLVQQDSFIVTMRMTFLATMRIVHRRITTNVAPRKAHAPLTRAQRSSPTRTRQRMCIAETLHALTPTSTAVAMRQLHANSSRVLKAKCGRTKLRRCDVREGHVIERSTLILAARSSRLRLPQQLRQRPPQLLRTQGTRARRRRVCKLALGDVWSCSCCSQEASLDSCPPLFAACESDMIALLTPAPWKYS